MIRYTFVFRHDAGEVAVTFELYEEAGELICGIYQFEGVMPFPPKTWLKLIRTEIKTIERLARDAGCVELRLGGRDWSRILPDYEPLDGIPNGLRKRLT